jgi:pimeloyl-ACP methyl ester carboxylesterase
MRTSDAPLKHDPAEFDVLHLFAKVRTPALVLHVRDDLRVPIALGRELAVGIPNAHFVTLPGKYNVILVQDPGAALFLSELKGFVEAPRSRTAN